MIEQVRKFLPTDNDVAQKELQAMERKSEELLTLVREMIDFNKGTREEVRVSELAVTSANASSAEGIINPQTPPTEPYILVAEDDSDVALLITEMLKEEGYPYYWAKDGQEAYNVIHGYPPPIFGHYRHYDAKYGRSGTHKKNQERTGHQSSAIDSGFCTRGG
jgi:PleD family two-component response regulator